MGVEKVFMGFIWREKGWSGLQGKSAEKNFRRELHCNLQISKKSELPDNLKVVFCLFVYKEDARNLREVGKLALPFLDGLGLDVFALAGDVGGNAKLGLRTAILHDVLHHLVVAIRSLDEELCLVFGINATFQCLDALSPFTRFDRQISMESEALPVEARAHDREYDGRRTYQRHHLQVLSLGYRHDIGSRVGHRRTSGFGNHPHGCSCLQRLQVTGYVFGRSMLVERIEREFIDVDASFHLLQETTCRTYILDNEMLDAEDDFLVIGRQYLFDGGIA